MYWTELATVALHMNVFVLSFDSCSCWSLFDSCSCFHNSCKTITGVSFGDKGRSAVRFCEV